jgi:hypothetical protein
MAFTDVLPPDESIFEDKEHVEFLQVVSNELSSTSTARLWIWSREGQDWIERVKNAIQLQEDAELRLLQAVLKRRFLSLQIAAAISRGVGWGGGLVLQLPQLSYFDCLRHLSMLMQSFARRRLCVSQYRSQKQALSILVGSLRRRLCSDRFALALEVSLLLAAAAAAAAVASPALAPAAIGDEVRLKVSSMKALNLEMKPCNVHDMAATTCPAADLNIPANQRKIQQESTQPAAFETRREIEERERRKSAKLAERRKHERKQEAALMAEAASAMAERVMLKTPVMRHVTKQMSDKCKQTPALFRASRLVRFGQRGQEEGGDPGGGGLGDERERDSSVHTESSAMGGVAKELDVAASEGVVEMAQVT